MSIFPPWIMELSQSGIKTSCIENNLYWQMRCQCCHYKRRIQMLRQWLICNSNASDAGPVFVLIPMGQKPIVVWSHKIRRPRFQDRRNNWQGSGLSLPTPGACLELTPFQHFNKKSNWSVIIMAIRLRAWKMGPNGVSCGTPFLVCFFGALESIAGQID